MKKLIAFFTSAILLCITLPAQNIIPLTSWNFNQSTAPSYSDLNVSSSAVTLNGVSNISIESACDLTGYHGKDWTSETIVNLTQYYEFTVSPEVNFTVDIANITFGYIRSNHGPANGQLRSSIDNYAATSAINFNFLQQGNLCYNHSIDLGANPAYLSVSSPVTFRIYAFNSGNSNQGRVLKLDDIVVNGIIFPGTALPVKLVSVNAHYINNSVELSWITAIEQDNEYFIIEKSMNGKEFDAIGKVDGAVNSTSIRNYSFIDTDARGEKLFYRLKQVDLDGKFSYSSIVPVNIKNGSTETRATAITGTNKIAVHHSAQKDETIQVDIIDMTGRKIESYNLPVNKGNNYYDLSTGSLSAGTYILSVTTDREVVSTKFVR